MDMFAMLLVLATIGVTVWGLSGQTAANSILGFFAVVSGALFAVSAYGIGIHEWGYACIGGIAGIATLYFFFRILKNYQDIRDQQPDMKIPHELAERLIVKQRKK